MPPAVAADLPRTLAEFAASPDGLLDHLRAGGQGRRLEVAGGRTVVVVDEEVYKRLRQEEVRASVLASVIDADAGNTVDAREFLLSLGRDKP